MADRGRIFVATQSFEAKVDGVPAQVQADRTRVREGHDLLRRFPQYFREIDAHYEVDVEQATAAPGERRG